MSNIHLSDRYFKKHINVSADSAYIEAENRRLAKQASCTHDITVTFRKYDKWSTKCEICKLIIDSDALHESESKTNEQLL